MGTASDVRQGDVSADHPHPPAHTPNPDPSPLEGEGRRYQEGHRYTEHAAGAAKRMRREPTLGERKLWAELRKLPLHVRRQAPIGRYIADFVIHSARLVIEVDGASHRGEAAELHDGERDAALAGQGFRILRLPDADVLADPAACAARVLAAATA